MVAEFEVTPERTLFLGHDPQEGGRRLWTHDTRDSVGVVAPPGYGKTAGIIAPSVFAWDGPAIVATTRGDLLRLTGDHRRRLAEPHGGRVFVYDPLRTEPGVSTVGWSPIDGCQDATLCFKRVEEMTATLAQGVSNADHWRDGAAEILRGYLHAAALGRLDILTVRRWLAQQEIEEPTRILRGDSRAAAHWADDLDGLSKLGERERGTFYSTAKQALKATTEPNVLASVGLPGVSIDEFLASKSTLYIVGPIHYQQVMAPMIVGLVDSIVQRAVLLAAASPTGRIDPPLLVALDEVANIAPMMSLPAMVSEYGGRGIATLWATQTLSRMRVRYGRDEADAILQSSTAKLIYGAMSNGDDLRNISSWAGEYREPQVTFYAGDGVDPRMSPQQPGRLVGRDNEGHTHAIGYMYRPALPVQSLQQLPPLQAWLWYRSDPPLLVHAPPAGIVPAYQAVAGWTPELLAVSP
ncbi:MAG: type IV secretory system conjugative DNA transfer family protein [Catenulispora sp.]|nr:type IV secretory system conjugative DNA transfer family protein [Catenulispora sp.]NUT40047.1 type IV secretory system conjugative DNA transfer family protein [Thermoactinospora sp.]